MAGKPEEWFSKSKLAKGAAVRKGDVNALLVALLGLGRVEHNGIPVKTRLWRWLVPAAANGNGMTEDAA